MFKDKNIQYINIKKNKRQLKLENQILNDGKVSMTEQTSFIIDKQLTTDVVNKLKILQNNISETYITTLCESRNQKLVDDDFVDENYEIRDLTSHVRVAIPKEDLLNLEQYYLTTGMDYVFSPYNILYSHLLGYGVDANSVNIFILNDTIYCLIINGEKRVVHSSIKLLTPFEDVTDEEFDTNGIQGQQIFDEIHMLEVQEAITSITNEFYEQEIEDVFCESISIFYNVKQLTDEQIEQLEENIMMEIEYSAINIDEYLFTMSKQIHIERHSFMSAREKVAKKSPIKWIIGAIISTVIVGGILYFMQVAKAEEEQRLKDQQAKLIAEKKAEENRIKLPNHKMINNKISEVVSDLFEVIPDSVILSELQLQKKNSTIVCSYPKKEVFKDELQPALLKLYKTSKILLVQQNKEQFNAIISSSDRIQKKKLKKVIQSKYNKNKQLNRSEMLSHVKKLLPSNAQVVYINGKKKKTKMSHFNITTVMLTPQDFFDFVRRLNKDKYSINITYPIEFTQTQNNLELIINLEFNQLIPKPKKKK